MVIRFMIRVWWALVPHPIVPTPFASAICRRCGRQHMRVWF